VILLVIKMLQGIINAFVLLLNGIVAILPKSPFAGHWTDLVLDNKLLSALGWIIPFKSILAVSMAWLVAVGTFYLHMIILRWIKAIE